MAIPKKGSIRVSLSVVKDFIIWHRQTYGNARIDQWIAQKMLDTMLGL